MSENTQPESHVSEELGHDVDSKASIMNIKSQTS